MSKINFREMIEESMHKKGVSLTKLARRADLHHQTVFNYMKGYSEMTAANLENLLNTLEDLPNRRKKGD